MVAFVVVSHSEKLAEGVADLVKMVAREVTVVPAGGLPGGDYGTSFERITEAVNKATNPDGVIVLMDLGSAVMTAEMAVEMMDTESVKLADCPLVEGAVTGAVLASAGCGIDMILGELSKVPEQKKFEFSAGGVTY